MALSTLALCAGIGGLEIGVGRAVRTRVLGYVERDAYAAAVLLARMEDSSLEPAPVWCGNLEDFDAAPFAGVDLVTAGFPCQPFSVAGKRKGTEDERWLWPEIVRILRDVGPRLVFLENVPGILRQGLGEVLGTLAEFGFAAEWDFLPAADVGALHFRRRWWVLAADPCCMQLLEQCRGLGRPSRPDTLEPRRNGETGSSPGTPARISQPRVDRAGDGFRARVDRLRCLGNAVVPDQAALAFRVLADRLGIAHPASRESP